MAETNETNFTFTKEEKLAIHEAGQETASGLIEAAIGAAKDGKQLTFNIYVLRVTAVNILATEAFNVKKHHGMSFDDFAKELVEHIKGELETMEQEVETLVETGPGESTDEKPHEH